MRFEGFGFRPAMALAEKLRGAALGLIVAFEISRQLFRWEPEAKVPGRAKLWVLAAMIPFIAFGLYENAFGDRLDRVQYNFQMLSSGEKPPVRAPHSD